MWPGAQLALCQAWSQRGGLRGRRTATTLGLQTSGQGKVLRRGLKSKNSKKEETAIAAKVAEELKGKIGLVRQKESSRSESTSNSRAISYHRYHFSIWRNMCYWPPAMVQKVRDSQSFNVCAEGCATCWLASKKSSTCLAVRQCGKLQSPNSLICPGLGEWHVPSPLQPSGQLQQSRLDEVFDGCDQQGHELGPVCLANSVAALEPNHLCTPFPILTPRTLHPKYLIQGEYNQEVYTVYTCFRTLGE